MRLRVAGLTDIGLKRSQNQDSLLILPDENLFIVADGMGGHKGGEVASQLAIETIGDFFKTNALKSEPPHRRVFNALELANEVIQERSRQDTSLQGMGTTTVAFFFDSNKLWIGHVGDSRGYLINDGGLWQLTQDHSLVQEKIKAGIITRDQAKTDKMKHVLTRSVGVEPQVEIDIYEVEVRPGDVFLSCSDGLHGLVEDAVIHEVVSRHLKEASQSTGQNYDATFGSTVDELVDLAKKNGGDDNITVFIAQAY